MRSGVGEVVLASIMLAANASAQSAALVGSVRVKDAAAPLTIAEVEIPALGLKTRVSAQGEFAFPVLPAGRHLVVVRAIGYSPRGDTIALTEGRETRRHFELPPAMTQLDTAVIVAPAQRYISPLLRAFEERHKNGQGRFIAEDELRRSDNREFVEVVRKLAGASVVRRGGSSYFVSARRVSGAGGTFMDAPRPGQQGVCYVTIYQDGVLAYDMEAMRNATPPRLEDFNVREWAGMEYFGGEAAVPAKYKSSPCGTLMLWTRER
jgi:hypothetical protein